MPDPDNIEYAYVCTRHDLYGAPNNGVEHQHDEPVDHRAGFNLHHEPADCDFLNGGIDHCSPGDFCYSDQYGGDPPHYCAHHLADDRGARDNGFIFPDHDAGEPVIHPEHDVRIAWNGPDDVGAHLRDW